MKITQLTFMVGRFWSRAKQGVYNVASFVIKTAVFWWTILFLAMKTQITEQVQSLLG